MILGHYYLKEVLCVLFLTPYVPDVGHIKHFVPSRIGNFVRRILLYFSPDFGTVPSSLMYDARFLCQQCTVYPVIFPWLFCHFAEQTHMHPRGALLAASPSRSRKASAADAISFVAVLSAVPNKAPPYRFSTSDK